MTRQVQADIHWAVDRIDAQMVEQSMENAAEQLTMLLSGKGSGSEYTGWLNLPAETSDALLTRLEESAEALRQQSDIVVVCGIGGSYLGARAGLEFLDGAPLTVLQDVHPRILFAGNSLSSWQLQRLLNDLADKRFSIVVISKSGTTLETAVAFHLLRAELVRRFGIEDARKRIVAITDAQHGTLHDLASQEGFVTFDLPRDIGGRYSVLTPVGLLPFAVAGVDIRAMLMGAGEQRSVSLGSPVHANDALQYAVARRLLNASGKTVELLTSFEPCLHYTGEWWKQLFGESEGKNGKGVFPASADFTTDLHSLGQFVQEGTDLLFETNVDVPSIGEVTFVCDADSPDELAYLSGRSLSAMNRQARLGSLLAHHDGGVPVIRITIPDISARSFGSMVYFFEVSCAVGGYMLGINPFDQPGVEAYKRNMFALLGRPGTEADGAVLRSRLDKEG